MLSWLLLKVLANGFILNPNAAIKSLWDVLDWIIVLVCVWGVSTVFRTTILTQDCIVVLVGSTIWITIWGQREEPIGAVLSSPTLIDRGWASVFLAIRVIRPLHAISIVPAFRSVVRELVEGWRNLLLGALILFLFLFMFASLGVQVCGYQHKVHVLWHVIHSLYSCLQAQMRTTLKHSVTTRPSQLKASVWESL